MIGLALALVFIAGLAYIAYRAVANYRATPDMSLLTAFENSATIAWQRMVQASALLLGAVIYLADYLNAPGVADAIKSVMKPEYVPPLIVAIAIITEIARRRRGSSDPV